MSFVDTLDDVVDQRQRIGEKSPFQCLVPDLNLDSIKKMFDNIPIDPHFDGGYRYRTQSLFTRKNGRFEFLPSQPLFQPSYINSYQNYGGKARHYEGMPDWVIYDEYFYILINTWLATLPVEVEKFSAHQIRTTMDGGEVVPEGRHRDGYDYIGVYVVRRQNIKPDCAVSTVWEGKTDKILFEEVVAEGKLLSFDDRIVTHNVTKIAADDLSQECVRDVIILTVPEVCIG